MLTRRPIRSPGFVVGVIDERRLMGGVVHSEAVGDPALIAGKMDDFAAQVAGGELS